MLYSSSNIAQPRSLQDVSHRSRRKQDQEGTVDQSNVVDDWGDALQYEGLWQE